VEVFVHARRLRFRERALFSFSILSLCVHRVVRIVRVMDADALAVKAAARQKWQTHRTLSRGRGRGRGRGAGRGAGGDDATDDAGGAGDEVAALPSSEDDGGDDGDERAPAKAADLRELVASLGPLDAAACRRRRVSLLQKRAVEEGEEGAGDPLAVDAAGLADLLSSLRASEVVGVDRGIMSDGTSDSESENDGASCSEGEGEERELSEEEEEEATAATPARAEAPPAPAPPAAAAPAAPPPPPPPSDNLDDELDALLAGG